MSKMDLETRLNTLPCIKCEEVKDCDSCSYMQETKEIYHQLRHEAINDCICILKTYHIARTAKDDFNPQIEVPFYKNLKQAFEKLKI